jgi:hypothetical protein
MGILREAALTGTIVAYRAAEGKPVSFLRHFLCLPLRGGTIHHGAAPLLSLPGFCDASNSKTLAS